MSKNCRITSFHVYLQAAVLAVGRQLQTRANQPIVRSNLLLEPDTLGNWVDGHISCRHSALIYFLIADALCTVLEMHFYFVFYSIFGGEAFCLYLWLKLHLFSYSSSYSSNSFLPMLTKSCLSV